MDKKVAQITTVEDFFSLKDIENLICLHNHEEYVSGSVGEGEIISNYRDVDISYLDLSNTYFIDIVQKIVDTVFEANTRLWNFDLEGLNENVQYLSYSKGQHYKLHSDLIWDNINSDKLSRKCTFILQLSDPNSYKGGEVALGFNDIDSLIIPKDIGSLTIFPSILVHKVKKVTEGTRNSICGWVSGKSWK